MDEYIRRGAAIEQFEDSTSAIPEKLARIRIKEIHAADVVEVVRCRECIFWDTSWNPGVGMNGEAYYCPRCHLVTLKDSFCSGAYRKDGGQDDGT